MSRLRAHLAGTIQWSAEAQIEVAQTVAAALGMSVPVLLALFWGDPAPGLAAATGSLAVGRPVIDERVGVRLWREAEALAPALIAAGLAVGCAGLGRCCAAALVLLSGCAAIAGGVSRPMAVATTRFILFLMITSAVTTSAVAPTARQGIGFIALVAGGALWTSALGIVFGAMMRGQRQRRCTAPDVAPTATTTSVPTVRQRCAQLRRSLASLAGWSYPLRLSCCLGVAMAIDFGWPGHNFHWIALTVAILTPRRIELVPVKVTQRALGTLVGVGAAGAALSVGPPSWVLMAAIGPLAGARALLRAKNYFAYSVVMTPLIVLLIDAGRPADSGVLRDRLIATLIGAALVVGANLLMVRVLQEPTA